MHVYLISVSQESSIDQLKIQIMAVAQGDRNTHFFMDEVPFGQPGVNTEFVRELSKLVQPESLIWIACKKTKRPDASQPELRG